MLVNILSMEIVHSLRILPQLQFILLVFVTVIPKLLLRIFLETFHLSTIILQLQYSYVIGDPDGIIPGNLAFINNTFTGGGGIFFSAVNGTISISGSILFFNNTCLHSRGLVQLFGVTWYISGSVSFIQNDNVHADSGRDFTGGAAIFSDNSTLFISGVASFVGNRVIAPIMISNIDVTGGAIYACDQSTLVFEESSDTLFIQNFATYHGGAVSLIDSNLTMYGRAFFETNSAGMEGGAIYSLNSVINMTGRVVFNQNSAQWGGEMAFSGSSSKLRLIEPLAVNFVENSAILGGGVIFFEDDANQMCFRSQITQDCFVELSSISNIGLNFNNNSAERAGRIFYGGHLDTCTPIIGGWAFFWWPGFESHCRCLKCECECQ